MEENLKKTTLICLLLLAIILAVALRIGFITVQRPFLQTVAQNQLTILPVMNLSMNMAPKFSESPILSYIIYYPYVLLSSFITINDMVALVKIGMAILSCLVIFFIIKDITKTNKTALFGMTLFAIQPTAILTQGLLIYSGDLFTPLFTVIAVYFLIKFEENRRLQNLILSIATLILAIFIWNGGIIAIFGYLAVLMALLLWQKAQPLYILILFIIITIAIYVIYPHIPYLPGLPSILNVNTNSTGWFPIVLWLNLYTLLTQEIVPIFLMLGIINFLFVYWCPLIYTLIKQEFLKNKMFFAMLILLVVSAPISLYDGRFESLIIISLSILAGVSAKYTLPIFFSSKRNALIFITVGVLMILTAAYGTWLIGGLE